MAWPRRNVEVKFHTWGCSSTGGAAALQAEGMRVRLPSSPRWEDRVTL